MDEQLPKSLQTFVEPFHFRIFIDENEGDWKMPFEWHEYLEIFYVLDGVGTYFIEDKRYTFKTGDLFILGNYELHKSQLIDGQPFKAIILMFDPHLITKTDNSGGKDLLSLFFDRPADFSHQLKVNGNLHNKIMFLFDQMFEETENGDNRSNYTISLIMQWLLVELNRAYKNEQQINLIKSHQRLPMKKVVRNMLEFIDEHYKEDIHLEEVAKSLNVNPSYLSREFKKALGFSLIEFITSKRIRTAREMLRNTSLSVTEIASEIGYNNVTHFHWTFKKLIGISPGQFRKVSKYHHQQKSSLKDKRRGLFD
ncbi:AraC family transcriptional regulator [Bacillus shivajii]|uniref:AraC family transcriptional regulator n=1 Tax=Bacillus shivajii TaxID=1983719 RepID=UPI001CFB94B1|nr:AraC family transcriptional regulator [Bacillus shivajii]UCZ52804.1 AraC family transcriptional regulator [Bacillus shivajii]